MLMFDWYDFRGGNDDNGFAKDYFDLELDPTLGAAFNTLDDDGAGEWDTADDDGTDNEKGEGKAKRDRA